LAGATAVEKELEEYKKSPMLAVEYDKNELRPWSQQPCPLRWWASNRQRLPILFRLAYKLLSIPLSSTASERLFSVTGDLTGKKRASVSPALLHAEVVLKEPLTER
jgi:hypothetical protein